MERTDRRDVNSALRMPVRARRLSSLTVLQSISQASQVADQMGDQLQAQLEETVASYMIQLDATKNAERLAFVLENLTSTTQVELQQINNATHTIRESLLVTQGRESRIWYSILLSGFRLLGRGMIQ